MSDTVSATDVFINQPSDIRLSVRAANAYPQDSAGGKKMEITPRRRISLFGLHGAMLALVLGMLIAQGALSFEMWTGQWPPENVMRAACADVLNEEA